MENISGAFNTYPGDPDGFRLNFKNGWTVSVAWGRGNYGSGDTVAEVAYWKGDIGQATVEGWQTPEDVARIVAQVATRRQPRDTETTCHCGAKYYSAGGGTADHCDECGCEQYESVHCSTWCGQG